RSVSYVPRKALASRPAAVDGDGLAGAVARRVGGQEQQRAVELGRIAEAAHRTRALHERDRRLVDDHLGRHLTREPTGRERVDPHALARPLRGELTREV